MSHDTTSRSGRFVVRLPPALHQRLVDSAQREGISLNEYCMRRLAVPASGGEGWLAEPLRRAESLFGDALIGVVLFGSRARGDEHADSDADLLIVADARVRIDRALYRAWDDSSEGGDADPRLEPHFAHLPAPDGRTSALWAEIAMDGVVLFERGFAVSRHLARIRDRIARGQLVRRTVNGIPYWVDAA